MQDLRITLVQADQKWEDKSGNFENYRKLIPGDLQTDLILLPEMFNTSFSMNTGLAEEMSGESIFWLKEIARDFECAVYTSLMIREEGANFNRGVFVFPDGQLEYYDKRKTFGMAGEDQYFNSGITEKIVRFKDWNIQLQICYDLRFPEISRNSITRSGPAYDLLLYVANWPEKRATHWKALLQARAIENQCFLAGVNRVGTDGNGYPYSGDSRIVNALGEISELTPGKEMVQTYVINKTDLNDLREMLPFLKDR